MTACEPVVMHVEPVVALLAILWECLFWCEGHEFGNWA